jgi:uncharacterized protein with PQ loop repeat
MPTTTTTIVQWLGMAATAYGVLAALSVLLQVRQMLAHHTSCDISGRFFAVYAGGYAIWLLYGLTDGNLPLIIVDTVGLLCGALTLVVTLTLRGSLIHPSQWTNCTPRPMSAANASSEFFPRQYDDAYVHQTGARKRRSESTGRLRGARPDHDPKRQAATWISERLSRG